MPYKRGGFKMCVIIGCHQKKLYDWKKAHCEEHGLLHEDYPCLQPFSMLCIPKNAERRRAWIRAINRKDFDPKNKDQVCSIRFLDGRLTGLNPDPVLHLGYKIEVKPGRRKFTRVPFLPISTECNKPCPTIEDFHTFSNKACELAGDGHIESTKVQSSNHCSQTEPVICHFAEEKMSLC
ncbi:uncharacterized protein LOC125654138 [Ostrea edulis]|uniref:uncharacterized protein LOC125654138 n=1 Tax=Ostrea edulis TaxID=37623 RepID=UPI0024AFFF46|nr:uncharacterized protein LOC125654138 [Ostrea edulis]